MAERPLVINAKVINLLNAAPVRNLRPALGSLIQRKTLDVGCYPFPFMVNEQNVPLDGRVVGGVTLDTRPVPYWCSENAYATKYGDATYNNGDIVWSGGAGGIKQKGTGNSGIIIPNAFRYDSVLGVTYPTRRVNMSFVGMEETVPVEWENLKNAYYAGGVTFTGEDGVTLGIASNVLFKVWTGLTFEQRTIVGGSGVTYVLKPMSNYILGGGTYSQSLALYNYQCLDQIFNSPFITQVGGDPNTFWEGSGYGLSFGVSAGTTGELFLLNAVYAGNNPNLAGSYYLENAGSCADFPYSQFFLGATAGSTFSGRQLAINMAGAGGVVPFLRADEPYPGRSFIDTMALILGTNQTVVTLVTGGTASIRSIDFNNPCSSSLLYREDTELGRWGYDIERINLEYQTTPPPIPTDFGCHIGSFIEYMSGPTAIQNGLYHPLSLMFWRQISSGTDVQGTINDYVGDDPLSSEPVINKLEGIHDYLCYEYYSGSTLESRVYYPIRPITKQWYDSNFIPAYNSNGGGDSETVGGFGTTLENKFSVGFPEAFRGDGSVNDPISLKYLEENPTNTNTNFDFVGTSSLTGVTGVAFPYMIPIFTYGMKGIPNKTLDIQGEFQNFESSWNRDLFGVGDESLNSELYPYYADGVSSGADFRSDAISPYNFETLDGKHNFRLYSWDALNKISPNDTSGSPVRSSFSALPEGDGLGRLTYKQTGANQRIEMDGTEVSVDPLLFPPAVLPSEPISGLKVNGINLGCDAYVNLVRYANSVSLDNTTPGLTAKRVLLASKDLSDSTQTFAEFEGGSEFLDDPQQVFTRTGDAPNASNNFYTPVPDSGDLSSGGNFFFRTAGSTLTVFGGSYYLTPSDYVTKYVGGTEFAGNWWENVSVPPDQIDGIAALISELLSAPNPGDVWSSDTTTNLFKGSPYNFESEAPNGTGGIAAALGGENRLHPAFVYRLLTSSALGSNPFYTESCLESWSYGGTPCHKVPDIIEPFYSGFDSYFGSGATGCGQYGQDEVDENSYLDFFYRCRLGDDVFSERVYAYSAAYFNPGLNSLYSYQNEGCNTSGGGIPDPPAGATLTPFGLTFASALAAVAGTDINFGDQSQTGRLAVRNVFGFSGNTATTLPNGSNNSVGTPVSQWLQEKLESLFEFYNENYPATDAPTRAKVEKVNRFFTALYGQDFTDYEAGLQNSKTYKLWAIKPRCLEEMDADCLALARQLLNNTQTAAATDGGNYIFRDPKPPVDKLTRQKISDLQRSNISPNRPITTSDITPTNDGFLSAFQTIYVEPLGKAPNVLATQAQAVSRATIRSTVFGKLISVIDSRGMLRDANVITLESGFGTKITGSSGGNAITISVEGLSLGSLNDVSSVAATDGDVLSYDLVNARWINRSLYDLNDIHSGMPYIFSGNTQPLFNLNIGQVGGADLTTVLANAGTLKFNGKPEKTPTEVYFSVSDANGNNQTGLFNRFGTGVAGTLLLKKFGDPNTFYRFQVDGLTGPYATAPGGSAADTGVQVSLINSGTGTLSEGDRLTAFLFLEPATNRVNFYYQALPPTGAGVTGGSRWMNSETGTEYIYINDGDTNQWVQAV